jgi:hypothetical protein
MTHSNKIGIVFIVLGAVSIIYLSWYSVQHTMDEVRPYEINDPHLTHHILIATQGSEFKDALVHEVIKRLQSQPVYIRVIDVAALSNMRESEWSAIVILHTWENWKPQRDAQFFVDHAESRDKIIMLSTSGSGSRKMKTIDGITAASEMNEVSAKAKEIVTRIQNILNSHISFINSDTPG